MASAQESCLTCHNALPSFYYRHFYDINRIVKSCTLCRLDKMMKKFGHSYNLNEQRYGAFKAEKLGQLNQHCDELISTRKMTSADKNQMMQVFQSSRAFTTPLATAHADDTSSLDQGHYQLVDPATPQHGAVEPQYHLQARDAAAEVANALNGTTPIEYHTYYSVMALATNPAMVALKETERQRTMAPLDNHDVDSSEVTSGPENAETAASSNTDLVSQDSNANLDSSDSNGGMEIIQEDPDFTQEIDNFLERYEREDEMARHRR